MYPNFFDTHAHLDHRQFASDLDAVIARAAEAGISRILTIGTDLESSRRSVALAEANPGVYAVVGVHPCDVDAAPDDVRPALRDLAIHPKVVAIGSLSPARGRRGGVIVRARSSRTAGEAV